MRIYLSSLNSQHFNTNLKPYKYIQGKIIESKIILHVNAYILCVTKWHTIVWQKHIELSFKRLE